MSKVAPNWVIVLQRHNLHTRTYSIAIGPREYQSMHVAAAEIGHGWTKVQGVPLTGKSTCSRISVEVLSTRVRTWGGSTLN